MPDSWEKAKGLNPSNASDAQLTTVDGKYPNVEVYLNSLVSDIVNNENAGGVVTASNDIQKNSDETKIYLNSATNELYIQHPIVVTGVQIFAITGVLLFSVRTNQQTLQLQLPQLPKGVNIVRIQDLSNRYSSKKILIR